MISSYSCLESIVNPPKNKTYKLIEEILELLSSYLTHSYEKLSSMQPYCLINKINYHDDI